MSQRKLNRLIDDGVVRPGEIDNRTLDALEGALSASLPVFQGAACVFELVVSVGIM